MPALFAGSQRARRGGNPPAPAFPRRGKRERGRRASRPQPSVSRRKRLDPPIAFAHRGAKAHAPENTIEAFTLALRLGATGLESDVWLTSDGVPVLDHDGVVRARLRSAKTPARVLVRESLPHTDTGKALRRVLRAELTAEESAH